MLRWWWWCRHESTPCISCLWQVPLVAVCFYLALQRLLRRTSSTSLVVDPDCFRLQHHSVMLSAVIVLLHSYLINALKKQLWDLFRQLRLLPIYFLSLIFLTSASITATFFHSRLKTYLFNRSFSRTICSSYASDYHHGSLDCFRIFYVQRFVF